MFERYTEKARRVIFFARYEASMSGSAEINTEHILLALYREAPVMMRKCVPGLTKEGARRLVNKHMPPGKRPATSVDLPLTQHAKRVLAFAAEEAERLNHKHIGSEHLLLGLAREKGCLAAKMLSDGEFDAARLREDLARVHPPARPERSKAQVVRKAEEWAVLYEWAERRCEARDALRNRVNQRLCLYSGEPYNEAHFELIKGGWTHYLCAICWRDLYVPDHPDRSLGHTNGQEWICSSCYKSFAAPVEDDEGDDEK